MSITAVVMAKNESVRLHRCLDSLRGKVDRLVFVDTGSTDGSVDLVRNLWPDCIVHQVEWVNFGHNRTLAINLAKQAGGDYILVLDADQTLEGTLPALNEPAYEMMLHHGGMLYPKVQLFLAVLPWRYEGVTHEYLTCDLPIPMTRLDSAFVIEHADSHRRTTDAKFKDDIRLLEAEVQQNPTNSRAMFYLARTYDDMNAGDYCVSRYEKRIAMGGYADEIFYSHFRIGVVKSDLMHLFRAMEISPHRWEPIHAACSLLNRAGNYQASYSLSKRVIDGPGRAEGLFVNPAVYDHLLLFEHTISAYYVGQYAECAAISSWLLGLDLPIMIKSALLRNMEFLKGKVQ